MSLADELKQGVTALGLKLSSEAQQRLLNYLALINKWNRVYNLTAVREPQKMVSHHLLDSLAVVPHIEAQNIVDVGSGAGLPGIPLAIAREEWQVTLLDGNHKKAAFLRQAAIELKLANVAVRCERAEDFQPQEKFDCVISRALSDLPEYVELAGHLCKITGTVVAMKGVYPYKELARLPRKFKMQQVIPLKVPGLKAERHLVIVKAA
ncbi:MAG TPA: 16S rRNA (guanine(527)-N(7))-methyltransferase RsmG [Burkholderiales bacterium]|nr:16S rRNA (guanine(527)-N(7))-methyltransferase RsmG [Burkholderiales bacterium]